MVGDMGRRYDKLEGVMCAKALKCKTGLGDRGAWQEPDEKGMLRSLDLILYAIEACQPRKGRDQLLFLLSHARGLCSFLLGMTKITVAMIKSSWTASVKSQLASRTTAMGIS